MSKLMSQYHVQILSGKLKNKIFNNLNQYHNQLLFIIVRSPVPKKPNQKRNYLNARISRKKRISLRYHLDLNRANRYRSLSKLKIYANLNQSCLKENDIYLYLIRFPLLLSTNSHKI